MVDVVNSSQASAILLRGGSVGGASVRPATQNVAVETLSQGAPQTPQAPYISPYIAINFDYDKAVIQIRDADTGDVEAQFPTESRMAELRRAQAQLEHSRTVETAKLEAPETPGGGAEQTQQVSQSTDVITVQDISSSPPANSQQFSPQIAVAALSAAAQSGQASAQASVSLQA